jgi:hypothetical protein
MEVGGTAAPAASAVLGQGVASVSAGFSGLSGKFGKWRSAGGTPKDYAPPSDAGSPAE